MANAVSSVITPEATNQSRIKIYGKKAVSALSKIEEINIAGSGITLTKGKTAVESWLPYAEKFTRYLHENPIPIYFMLDEFPWFLGHVAKNYTSSEVDGFLNWFRKLRQEISDTNTRFLVTGSIGLEGLLRSLNISPTANDFDSIEIDPLSDTDALNYLKLVAEGESVALSSAARNRIIKRLGVGWPILLATFVSEVQEFESNRKNGPTVREIDLIYEDEMVRGNRNKYCKEMFTRLEKEGLFSTSEQVLAREILRQLCRVESGFGGQELNEIHCNLIPDKSHRLLLKGELDFVIETLVHDGYLIRKSDKDSSTDGQFFFASNILKDFWKHRTA